LGYEVGKMNAVFNCVDDIDDDDDNNNNASRIKDKISCFSHLVRPFPKNLFQNFWAPDFKSNANM